MGDREIIEAVQAIAGTRFRDEVTHIACNVDQINDDGRSITVTTIGGDSSVTFDNVQLMAEVDDGVLLVPSVNSTVIIGYSKRTAPVVLLFSSVDRIEMHVAGSSLKIDSNGITLNDGSLGGLVKVKDLVTRLNNIENLVNDLVSKFNSHTHILTLSTGTGTAAPTTTTEATTLQKTQQSDIENTKITHGN